MAKRSNGGISTFKSSANNRMQGKKTQKGMSINEMRDTANNKGQTKFSVRQAGLMGVSGASPRTMRSN